MHRTAHSALLVVLIGGSNVNGATYYWDTNGAAAGIGSAASPVAWLTNSWATGSTGALATGAWPNANPDNADEAVFMGTAGMVTVGANVYANLLRFQTNNYTISSTGGVLHLAGDDPRVTVNLASNNQVVTVSAPIVSTNGWTLAGNSLSGGLKFLVLANPNSVAPNSFGGPLVIEAGGALRLGGGVAAEQIPDDSDMLVAGVIDFITSGGASDGKQERVRDVTVSGATAIFSVGNGSDFIVNSMTGLGTETGSGISINGNNASVPGKLSITGWADGNGHLTLNNSRVKLNTTGATSAIGGRVVLSGDLISSGDSWVINNNGSAASAAMNTFTHKAFDFAGISHTVHVADGVLTFTSAAAERPLEITTTEPSGAVVTKTGPGVWLLEHAVQTAFAGTNVVEEGTLRIGASERLADAADLEVTGGTLDLQNFTETVATARLAGGSIIGSGSLATSDGFLAEHGTVEVVISGIGGVRKIGAGTVQLQSANTYAGDTRVENGALQITNVAGLPDSTNVLLAAGATLDLDFVGTDAIAGLVLPGMTQALGSWGAVGNLAADYTSPWIAGTGLLNVTTFVGLPGDFNGDNVVDAADYTVWRNHFGEPTEASIHNNGDGIGGVDDADYALWKDYYGSSLPGAGGLAHAVPEPTAAALATIAALINAAGTRSRTITSSFPFPRLATPC